MEKIKACLLGVFIGVIIGAVLMYRYKPVKEIFVTPKEIQGGQVTKWRLPADISCCIKMIVKKDGGFDFEYYN